MQLRRICPGCCEECGEQESVGPQRCVGSPGRGGWGPPILPEIVGAGVPLGGRRAGYQAALLILIFFKMKSNVLSLCFLKHYSPGKLPGTQCRKFFDYFWILPRMRWGLWNPVPICGGASHGSLGCRGVCHISATQVHLRWSFSVHTVQSQGAPFTWHWH